MRKILNCILCTVIVTQCIFPSVLAQGKTIEEETCNDCVVSIDFSKFKKNIDEDKLMESVKGTLLNANKYALGGWFNDLKNLDEDQGEYYDLYKASKNSTTPEYIYRFPAAQAFGVAISLQTGAYDESIIGVDSQEAKEKAIKLASSVAYGHKSNGGHFKSWGDDWQGAHWAYYAGYAAWLLWDDLNPEQQKMIRNMVVNEANRFINQNALYWKTAKGKEVYKGDSKIEEDSWNSELLNLAYHMMPQHENADKWKYRMIEYQLAAFATPDMNTSNELIHGKEAKEWVGGYNVNSNGSVINHGIIHPQYNAAATGVNTSIVNSVIGDSLPLATKYNLDNLYKGLTTTKFDSPPYNAPGGAMYIDGSPEVYYPQGSDWGVGVYDTFANIDVSAYVYGYGEDAYKWALLHTNKVLEQQNRHDDGHTYEGNESTYPGKEEAITMRMGNSYMTLWLNQQVGVNFSNEAVNYPHEDLPKINENQEYIFANEAAFVRGGSNENTSYYPSDIIEIKNDGGEDASYTRESYLKFDVKDIKKLPETALLYIPAVEIGSQIADKSVTNTLEYIKDNSWLDETVTFKTRPEKTGQEIITWTPEQNGVFVDVSEYVKNAYASDGKLSLRMFSKVSAGGETFARYGTSRQADPNKRPRLTISYGEKMDTVIKGSSEQKIGQMFDLTLSAQNLTSVDKNQVEFKYDSTAFELVDVYSDQVDVADINTSFLGKATLKLLKSKSRSQVKDLVHFKLKALKDSKNENVLSITLKDKSSNIISTAEKSIWITNSDYSTNTITLHQNKSKTEVVSEDTFVRHAMDEKHPDEKELDCKSYANNTMTRQPFFKFNLPTKAEIDSVENIRLKFYVDANSNGGNKTYRFQYVPENIWTEKTLTWNTKPDSVKNIGPSDDSLPKTHPDSLHEQKIKENGYVEFDVTEKVKKLVEDGSTQMSLIVYGITSDNSSVKLMSKENDDESKRPVIVSKYKSSSINPLTLNAPISAKRFEEISVKLNAENVKNINQSVVTVPYSDSLKFSGINSVMEGLNISVIEDVPGKVVFKLESDKELSKDEKTNLFNINFKAINKGVGTISLIAATKDDEIKDTKEIILENESPKIPKLLIEDLPKISKGETFKVNLNIDDLELYTEYMLHANFDVTQFELQDVNSDFVKFKPNTAKSRMNLNTITTDKSQAVITYTLKALNDNAGAMLSFEVVNEDGSSVKKEITLEFKQEIIDKSELKKSIDEAEKIDLSKYTTESVGNFNEAMKEANTVYNDEKATSHDVERVMLKLEEATKNLKLKSSNEDNDQDNDQNNEQDNDQNNGSKPNEPDNSLEDKKESVVTGDSTNKINFAAFAIISFGAMLMLKTRKRHQ